jgi:hypothetical protein
LDIIPLWMDLIAEISTELERAEAARAYGNEGRARVCARRAAGMAARDFLNRRKLFPFNSAQNGKRSVSSYEALKTLGRYPGLAPEIKQAVDNLTLRVSEEFKLPSGIDLIEEAKIIIGGLE